MVNLILRWWDNPDASATLVIAIFGGIFAVYQLYQQPAERRRRILNSMVDLYKLSAKERGVILRDLPCLIQLGYEAIVEAVTSELEAIARLSAEDQAARHELLQHLTELRSEAGRWMKKDDEGKSIMGVSYTSAHEVLDSEFKFRSLMWCIEKIRDTDGYEAIGLSTELVTTARGAVDKLNDFAFEYENGAFPSRSMLGQLHVSLARAAKALEPIVWEGKGKESRWGRRIIRLGLACQHYNDVNRIHRINNMSWTSPVNDEVVIHPALCKPVFGKEIINPEIPYTPRLFPLLRLRTRSRYWLAVGRLQLRPRFLWAYGGRRLREHKRAEDKLSPALNFAVEKRRGSDSVASLNFTWTLATLPSGMDELFRQEQHQTAGRFSWLYLPKQSD